MSPFGGTPRNPKRIPEVLNRIEAIWTRSPNLRLCQLIGNCFKEEIGMRFYYIEDDALIEKLEAIYKEDQD